MKAYMLLPMVMRLSIMGTGFIWAREDENGSEEWEYQVSIKKGDIGVGNDGDDGLWLIDTFKTNLFA